MTFDYKSELSRYRHYYQQVQPALKKPEAVAYTMIILSFFTISFFGIFAIRPTLTTIAALTQEIEENTFINEQFDQKIAHLIQAQESYAAIEDDLPRIYASLPQTPEFPLLLRQMEEVSAEFNASISALYFQQLPLSPVSIAEATTTAVLQSQEAQPFSFTISLTGTYPQITQFLDRLIGISRLTIIKQIELRLDQNSEAIDMNVLLNSFYLPSP